MLKLHRLYSLCHVFRFFGIERGGAARLDVTEMTVACASIPKDKECSSTIAPTFTDVGAMSFLANSMEFFGSHQSLEPVVLITLRCPHSDPRWTAPKAWCILFDF